MNDLVARYLSSKGINITTQTSAKIPKGHRQPDFELHFDGKIYYGEGEWQHNATTGITQGIEYGQISGASGFFVIIYQDKLKKIVSERRQKTSDPEKLMKGAILQVYFSSSQNPSGLETITFESIADWIKSVASLERRQMDPNTFVSLMRDAVEQLAGFLPHGKNAPHLFEHVIAILPQKVEEEETARRATAYLLINQLVFYRILSAQGKLCPLLDPESIKSTSDIREAFEKILAIDYQAIFKSDVVSLFSDKSIPYIRSIVKIIENLQPEQFGRDLLGSFFHELIPVEVRKPVAAYYTNPYAARLLASLADIDWSDKVADFACGSGTLLVAAYERKLAQDKRTDSKTIHKQYLEKDITGVDIMPFAAHLAAVQLALQNPIELSNKNRVVVTDSTKLHLNEPIRPAKAVTIVPQQNLRDFGPGAKPAKTIESGSVSASGQGYSFKIGEQDVVIMNPPFTRKQFISPEHRRKLTEAFSEYRNYLNKEMGYYGYFILLADRFLRVGGRLAMVLPAAILRQSSMAGIRKFLHDRYSIEYIVSAGWRSAFSESTSLRDILLVAKKIDPWGKKPCHAALLKIPPTNDNIEQITKSINKVITDDSIEVKLVPQDEFKSDDWLALTSSSTLEDVNIELPVEMTTLDSISGLKLIQGMRLEASSDFVNTADTLISDPRAARAVWTIEKETTNRVVAKRDELTSISIPRSSLFPACRSISGLTRMLLSKPTDYVVVRRFAGDATFWSTKEPDKILIKRRDHVQSRTGKIVIAGYGNVDLTAVGTSHLAVIGKEPLAPTWNCWILDVPNMELAKWLTLWWNSTYHLLYLLRNRSDVRGSFLAWRKNCLLHSPIPDFSRLSESAKQRLSIAFSHLSKKDFPSITKQFHGDNELRMELDMAIGLALGCRKELLEKQLRDAYAAIASELDDMLTAMRGD